MSDILDLAGRVAFVTGAGQGVGRQIALHLAAHNAGGVAVNDYVLDRAEAVAEEVRAAGGRAFAVQADVSDHDAVKDAVARTVEAVEVVDMHDGEDHRLGPGRSGGKGRSQDRRDHRRNAIPPRTLSAHRWLLISVLNRNLVKNGD